MPIIMRSIEDPSDVQEVFEYAVVKNREAVWSWLYRISNLFSPWTLSGRGHFPYLAYFAIILVYDNGEGDAGKSVYLGHNKPPGPAQEKLFKEFDYHHRRPNLFYVTVSSAGRISVVPYFNYRIESSPLPSGLNYKSNH